MSDRSSDPLAYELEDMLASHLNNVDRTRYQDVRTATVARMRRMTRG